jgi:hypothetical protein
MSTEPSVTYHISPQLEKLTVLSQPRRRRDVSVWHVTLFDFICSSAVCSFVDFDFVSRLCVCRCFLACRLSRLCRSSFSLSLFLSTVSFLLVCYQTSRFFGSVSSISVVKTPRGSLPEVLGYQHLEHEAADRTRRFVTLWVTFIVLFLFVEFANRFLRNHCRLVTRPVHDDLPAIFD